MSLPPTTPPPQHQVDTNNNNIIWTLIPNNNMWPQTNHFPYLYNQQTTSSVVGMQNASMSTLLPTVMYNCMVLNQQMSELLNLQFYSTCQQVNDSHVYVYDEVALESLLPATTTCFLNNNQGSGTMLKAIQPEDLFESELNLLNINECSDEFMFDNQEETCKTTTTTCAPETNMLQLLTSDISPACSSVNETMFSLEAFQQYSKGTSIAKKCESTSTDSTSFNSSNNKQISPTSIGNISPTTFSQTKPARNNKKQSIIETTEQDMSKLFNSLIKKKRGRPPKVNFKVEFSEHAYSMIYNGKVDEAIKVESASSRRGKSRVLKSIPKHILENNESK